MIGRRAVLAAGTSLFAMQSLAQTAQPPLIAWLRFNAPETPPGGIMRDALARHGLMDGRDYRLAMKHLGSDASQLPALARQSVEEGAAVIIAFGSGAIRAASAATRMTPIVGTGALVELGFVASRNRPGGNITGVDISAPALDLKKIEVLRDLMPEARTFTYILDPNVSPSAQADALRTAEMLGLRMEAIPVSNAASLEAAFAKAATLGSPVNVANGPFTAQHSQIVTDLVRRHGLVAICEWREMVERGCLASYGYETDAIYVLTAEHVQRILKGARPSELPVLSPTHFRLVINGRVARERGLVLPVSILARADEVIE
jgi:putative ABC transport system substrate-binding protein